MSLTASPESKREGEALPHRTEQEFKVAGRLRRFKRPARISEGLLRGELADTRQTVVGDLSHEMRADTYRNMVEERGEDNRFHSLLHHGLSQQVCRCVRIDSIVGSHLYPPIQSTSKPSIVS